MKDLFDLDGSVAVVTGATSGIGLASARALGAKGARLVVAGLAEHRPADTASMLVEEGCIAVGVACDVRRPDDLAGLVQTAVESYGAIDILVCNAGVSLDRGPLQEVTDAVFDATIEVNLRAPMRLCNLVIPHMADRGGGSVIIISSIAGLRGNKVIGVYGMSKAANAQLARNLAVQWGASNVRVNAISPGVITTDFATNITEDPDLAAARLAKTPLGRFGHPDHVAGAVVYLASTAGGFVTGQNLVIDGGTLIAD